MRPGFNSTDVGHIFKNLRNAGSQAFKLIESGVDEANEIESYIDSVEMRLMQLLRITDEEREAFIELAGFEDRRN